MVIHLESVSASLRARRALGMWIDDLGVDQITRDELRRLPIAVRSQVHAIVTRMLECAIEYTDLSVLDPFTPQILFEYRPSVRLMMVLIMSLDRDLHEDTHAALDVARMEWEGASSRVLRALEGDIDERMRLVAREFVPRVMDLAARILLQIIATAGDKTLPLQRQPTSC